MAKHTRKTLVLHGLIGGRYLMNNASYLKKKSKILNVLIINTLTKKIFFFQKNCFFQKKMLSWQIENMNVIKDKIWV